MCGRDWSSDVCSSDLQRGGREELGSRQRGGSRGDERGKKAVAERREARIRKVAERGRRVMK